MAIEAMENTIYSALRDFHAALEIDSQELETDSQELETDSRDLETDSQDLMTAISNGLTRLDVLKPGNVHLMVLTELLQELCTYDIPNKFKTSWNSLQSQMQALIEAWCGIKVNKPHGSFVKTAPFNEQLIHFHDALVDLQYNTSHLKENHAGMCLFIHKNFATINNDGNKLAATIAATGSAALNSAYDIDLPRCNYELCVDGNKQEDNDINNLSVNATLKDTLKYLASQQHTSPTIYHPLYEIFQELAVPDENGDQINMSLSDKKIIISHDTESDITTISLLGHSDHYTITRANGTEQEHFRYDNREPVATFFIFLEVKPNAEKHYTATIKDFHYSACPELEKKIETFNIYHLPISPVKPPTKTKRKRRKPLKELVTNIKLGISRTTNDTTDADGKENNNAKQTGLQ